MTLYLLDDTVGIYKILISDQLVTHSHTIPVNPEHNCSLCNPIFPATCNRLDGLDIRRFRETAARVKWKTISISQKLPLITLIRNSSDILRNGSDPRRRPCKNHNQTFLAFNTIW
ncbi:hypothetical protein CSKR_203981 [Clonorchis sinensis]|uniref:Uncharacterized protein n=1 Tax=Clonorchis sinensis TaxID=79923 RepID=A0A8T1MQP0_CLOSI|nr:hypothetical protein CSKR_203981 [Clonorchis sinensis]